MSEITQALHVIFSWLKKNYPELEQSFKPGLSYEEIKGYDNKGNDNYCFTSEFYELYQWRNGTLTYPSGMVINKDDKFYILDDGGYMRHPENTNTIIETIDCIEPLSAIFFCPINSIDFCVCQEKENTVALLSPFLFGTSNGSELIFSKKLKKISPLLSSVPDVEDCFEITYLSMTEKFLDLADSIQSNAYFTSDTEYGKTLNVDTSKICRKRKVYSNEDDWRFLK